MNWSLLITLVTDVVVPDPEGRYYVTTDRGEKLRVPDNQYLQFLRGAKGALVVIEFDPATKEVQMAYPVKQDTIQTLGTPKQGEDKVLVQAMMSPTLYYLSLKHSRFREIYQLLTQAYKEGKEVALAIRPGGNMVEDARLV